MVMQREGEGKRNEVRGEKTQMLLLIERSLMEGPGCAVGDLGCRDNGRDGRMANKRDNRRSLVYGERNSFECYCRYFHC